MTLAFRLDWWLFGNGRGMASPFWDDVFYWLDGQFYRWGGGLGAQLYSIEWTMPKPGTRRKLFGHEFVVFHAHRKWLRVEVAWVLVRGVTDFETVSALKADLQKWGHGFR